MSTNPNYNYLAFATMTTAYSGTPSTPYRSNNTSKRLNRVEYPEQQYTLAAGSELEIIFMDGYVNGSYSEPIAFFIQYNGTPTTTIQNRNYNYKRTLTNKPSATEMGTSYIAGFIRLTGGSTGSLNTEYRYYEPVNYYTPSDYSNIYNVGTNAIRNAPYSGINNRVNIACFPVDLKYKRFLNLTSPDFHRMVTHIKVKNPSGTSATVNVYGCWFVETTDSAYGGISYSQDTRCPAKLAEYVLGNLRQTQAVYSDSYTEGTKLAALDSTITTAIDQITRTWAILTTSKDAEIEEEDWSVQQRISNN